jgi:hypothetical protein
MTLERPSWLQPLEGPRVCSICSYHKVYYEKIVHFPQKVALESGPIIEFNRLAMKCYCKDCFEDCGGKRV